MAESKQQPSSSKPQKKPRVNTPAAKAKRNQKYAARRKAGRAVAWAGEQRELEAARMKEMEEEVASMKEMAEEEARIAVERERERAEEEARIAREREAEVGAVAVLAGLWNGLRAPPDPRPSSAHSKEVGGSSSSQANHPRSGVAIRREERVRG